MQDPPDAIELVAAARRQLENELLPVLADPLLHAQSHAAAKVLAIVERELELTPQHEIEQWARLVSLQGGTIPARPAHIEMKMSIEWETRRLWEAVRAGRFDENAKRQELFDHLKQTAREKLEINNPDYLARVISE